MKLKKARKRASARMLGGRKRQRGPGGSLVFAPMCVVAVGERKYGALQRLARVVGCRRLRRFCRGWPLHVKLEPAIFAVIAGCTLRRWLSLTARQNTRRPPSKCGRSLCSLPFVLTRLARRELHGELVGRSSASYFGGFCVARWHAVSWEAGTKKKAKATGLFSLSTTPYW